MNLTCAGIVMKKLTTVINIKDAPEGWEDNLDYYYCGRLTKYANECFFGNPYRVHIHGNRENCIKKFKRDFDKSTRYYQKLVLRTLTGKILVCHCKPKSCHADILADFCNANHVDINYKLNKLNKDEEGLKFEK